MRGSAAFRAAVAPGGVLAGPWARNDLWRRARAVPSLDLRFAENKSLVDATTGQNLVTFTRASSGTYVGSQGVIKTAATNEARFGHNPTTGESLGLLVEEQRSNLLTYSEEIQNAAWSTTAASVTADATTAPNGTTTADKIVEDLANSSHGVFRYPTVTSNSTVTGSVFLKKAERQYIRLTIGDAFGANSATARIDLDAVTVVTITGGANPPTGVSATITSFANGWFRASITATLAGSSTNGLFGFNAVGGGWGSYTGDGTSGFFAWGAQLEAGAFPTSYIPTTTATVTRSADVASITGTAFSSWYRQDEGTVFWESALIAGNPPASSFPGYWSLNNGTGANQITGYALSATSNRMYVRESGTVYADITMPTFVAAAFAKSAGVYKVNDVAATTNGGTVGVDTTVPLPISDRLTIGAQATAAPTNGTIRRLTYWPARLPNNVLQEITR